MLKIIMICTYQNIIIIIITFLGFINGLSSIEDYEALLIKEYLTETPNSTLESVSKNSLNYELMHSTPPTDYEFNLNISYTYVRNILNLTITSSKDKCPYKSYDAELSILPYPDLIEGKRVDIIQPKTVAIFQNVVPYQRHKIMIIPEMRIKGSYSSDIKNETFYLGGYKLDSIDCNSLNSTILIIPDRKNMNIKVVIGVEPEYKSCFHMYEVQLVESVNNICSDNIVQMKNVTYDVKVTVNFINVSAGNYCIKYMGIHEFCPKSRCIPTLDHVELEALDIQDVTALPSIQISPYFSYVVPLVISITICLVLMVIIFLIWKGIIHYKQVFYLLDSIKKSYKEKEIMLQKEEIQSNNPKELIVPILYAQDCNNQNKVAVAMYNFIKECFHVKPVIDVEDTENICKGDVAWIENLVNYECPKLKRSNKVEDNKRLIILETKCAVKLYQAWQKHENLHYKRYSYLNELFIRGISHLLSNVERHKTDYCHLFVISFSYSPLEKMDIVPRKRFILPDCLVDLYNCLHNKPIDFTGQQAKILLQEWEEKKSFKELIHAIKEMEEYSARNPDYVDDLFLSDTDNLKDVYIV